METEKLEERPQVILLSRLSIHGETLHEALQSVCNTRWIARRSEFNADPVRLLLLLLREFTHLFPACMAFPRNRRPTVLIHGIGLDTVPAFVARKIAGCRVMLYVDGLEITGERRPGHRSLLRWAIMNADVVLCRTGRIEEEVHRLGGSNTRVLPAPFAPFTPLESGIGVIEKFDVVAVGELSETANQELLVDASGYLDPTIKIAIIGDGRRRRYLTTLSRRHGRNQISFFGELPPSWVHHMLSSSNLYVQCSGNEESPSSVLQAAYCGLPIIVLGSGHSPELKQLYGLRHLIPKDSNAASVAFAIEDALEHRPGLKREACKNREALERYAKSWPNMAMKALFS